MRITDAYSKVAEQPTTTGTTKVAEGQTAPSKEAGAAAKHEPVKVSVSDEARKLSAKADASFDAEKVNRLKNAIEQGTFKIDAGKIASKIVGPDPDGDGD